MQSGRSSLGWIFATGAEDLSDVDGTSGSYKYGPTNPISLPEFEILPSDSISLELLLYAAMLFREGVFSL